MSEQKVIEEIEKLIVFQLEEKEYIIPVQDILSIEKLSSVTRVPGTPSFVKGIMNLRGLITPIIELRERFDMPKGKYTNQTRVLIVSKNEKVVGLIVDSAHDVIDIDSAKIETRHDTSFVKGILQHEGRIMNLVSLEFVIS